MHNGIRQGDAPSTPSPKHLIMPSPDEIAAAMQSIDVLAGWLANTGLSEAAIAQWKYNALASLFPALSNLVESAKSLIGTTQIVPETGLSVTELASIITESCAKKIKAVDINKALVELGLQIRKEQERVWELTEAGSQYGQIFLATSKTNDWSGPQVKWLKSVIPLLEDYFQSFDEEDINESQKAKASLQKSGSSAHKSANSTSKEASRESWFIEERVKHLKQKANANQLIHIEMYANDFYKERHGKIPSKQPFKKSQASAFPVADVDILDTAIEKVMSQIQGTATKLT